MRLWLLGSLATLAACAPDLREDFPFDGDLPPGDYVTFEHLGDAVYEMKVDATEKESWVYVDLDGREHIPASSAVGTIGWDVAFQRYRIVSNGGVSGAGEVEVALLDGADFDALVQAPSSGYLADTADGADGNKDVDSAFLVGDGWYSYDFSVHRLQPRDHVYVVHTDQGHVALKLLSYYEAGTAARLTLHLKAVAAP